MDGFDHWAIANYLDKWSFRANAGMTTGRFSGDVTASQAFNASNDDQGIRKDLSSHQTGINYFGFAWQMTTTTPTTAPKVISWWDGTTCQCFLRANADGSFAIVRGDGTVIATSATGLWSHSTWYFLEIKIKISNSTATGDCQVRLNGNSTAIIDVTAASDIQNGSNAGFDRFSLRWTSLAAVSTHTTNHDDFYWMDDSGSVNNGFTGDVRICTLLPTGNGNSSQFVGSDGNSTNNFQLVDESQGNSDTDYVESSTVNDIDLYGFENLPASAATVKAIQTTTFARKTDAGTRTIAHMTRISSTNYQGADITLNAAYRNQETIQETSPATATAWTVSEVNGAEFGMKVTA